MLPYIKILHKITFSYQITSQNYFQLLNTPCTSPFTKILICNNLQLTVGSYSNGYYTNGSVFYLYVSNICVYCFFLAIIQLTELCLHMVVVIGGFRDSVSSRRVDTLSLLAPVSGHPCVTGIQLLHCVQTTGQQMGTETIDQHRITMNTSLPFRIENF